MDAIPQTTFSNAFSWIKTFEFRFKFPKGPINNIPALVQIMACRRPGDKPLSELMMASLLMHICVTRPQWVNVSCRIILNISVLKNLFNIWALKFEMAWTNFTYGEVLSSPAVEGHNWFGVHAYVIIINTLESTSFLMQIMACCLMAPSHYLN